MDLFVASVERHWDIIVYVAMWSVSILLGIVLFAKIFKALKMEMEFQDIFGIVVPILWLGLLLVVGPGDVAAFLKGVL